MDLIGAHVDLALGTNVLQLGEGAGGGPHGVDVQVARFLHQPGQRRGIDPHPTGSSIQGAPRRRRSDAMDVDDLRAASDAALVVAIGRWREEALAEAYRRHAGAAYALARRLLNDNQMAEEILQEVFLRLWNTPERFDPARGSLRAYLLAQTHGRA